MSEPYSWAKPTREELHLSVADAEPAVRMRVLELWERRDYASLASVAGFAHERLHVVFDALVYTAIHHMPERFKPGQPPFHAVTHQRDYMAMACLRGMVRLLHNRGSCDWSTPPYIN